MSPDFWAGMLILAGCTAFIALAIGAVAWSINGSIERERRREQAAAEPWSIGATIRWQDQEMERLKKDLKRRERAGG